MTAISSAKNELKAMGTLEFYGICDKGVRYLSSVFPGSHC